MPCSQTVRVVDQDGEIVANADVFAESEFYSSTGTTGSDGLCTLELIPTVIYVVDAPNYLTLEPAYFVACSGVIEDVIVSRDECIHRFIVRDQDGIGIEGATVECKNIFHINPSCVTNYEGGCGLIIKSGIAWTAEAYKDGFDSTSGSEQDFISCEPATTLYLSLIRPKKATQLEWQGSQEDEVYAKETVNFTIDLELEEGFIWNALINATVLLYVNGMQVASAITDGDGRATLSYSFPEEDVYEVQANFPASYGANGSLYLESNTSVHYVTVIPEDDDKNDIKMLAIYGVAAVALYAGGSMLPGKAGKVVPVIAIIPAGLAAYEGYKIVKEYL